MLETQIAETEKAAETVRAFEFYSTTASVGKTNGNGCRQPTGQLRQPTPQTLDGSSRGKS
jgi:hypothetical protein